MSKGWISVHRQMWDHWLWEEKPFTKGQAWIDILLLANHEDGKVLMDGELLDVFRGEHITSEPKLAERWGWKSRTKVRNFLDVLEKEGMIQNKKEGRKRTRLIVCNYNDYQTSKDNRKTTEEQEKDNRKTTERQQKDINNNDNNDNNMLLLSITEFEEETSRDTFPNFYQWVEEKNYIDCKYPNEDPYYLKYLHEKANFYSKSRGKNHPETIGAIKAFESKKASSAEEVILEAQKIS